MDLEAETPKLIVFNKGTNKKIIVSRTLAKSWKSGSGSQGSKTNVFNKGIKDKMIASRALAKIWKSGSRFQDLCMACPSIHLSWYNLIDLVSKTD